MPDVRMRFKDHDVVKMWTIEYDNDTGPNDEGFCEWWVVSNGRLSYECRSLHEAEWLCSLLNSIPSPAPAHCCPYMSEVASKRVAELEAELERFREEKRRKTKYVNFLIIPIDKFNEINAKTSASERRDGFLPYIKSLPEDYWSP